MGLCVVERARMNSRSAIGRSRCERDRLYHAIHWTKAPGRQQSRLRRIVDQMNDVKRALAKPSTHPAR
eukprot:2126904-Prymnesium_polylepis.1